MLNEHSLVNIPDFVSGICDSRLSIGVNSEDRLVICRQDAGAPRKSIEGEL
jgi:hypothetical protein